MPSLLEMQREFGAALLGQTPATGIPRGISVYLGNVHGNCAKALAAAYPMVRKIVGEAFFDGLAHAYALAHPSASGDLNEFGAQLTVFVAGWPHTQDLPYLPDVARMEWLAHCAYYAPDFTPPDLAKLAAIPEEHHAALPLSRAPGSALLVSEWPLARLWAVHQEDYVGDTDIHVQRGFDRVLILRPRWRVEVRAVAPGDYRFLAEAGRGAALGHALQAAAEVDPGFDPASALALWVSRGVVSL